MRIPCFPALGKGLLRAVLCPILAVSINFAPVDAAAQAEEAGMITGRVFNAGTNVNLEGAIVRLEDTAFSARTQRDGTFRLRVPPGTYRLATGYPGLDPFSESITVTTGETVRRDIGLTSEIYALDEFTVATDREGSALAITLQRHAPNVKSVVSADAFGALQGNPGDVLMRLPGVTGIDTGGEIRFVEVRGMNPALNSVTVDGNRMANTGSADNNRSFQLQTLVSEGIERVEVTKSPTPDMDADSIGGAVNMVSTSAFDRPGRRLALQYGMTTRPDDSRDYIHPHYSISYSEAFGDRFGVSLSYGHRQQLSAIDGTTLQHERNLEDPYYTWYAQLRDFTNVRTRWGGNLKLDYKLSEQTRFFSNVSMNKHYENENTMTATFETGRSVADVDGNGNFTGRGAILPDYTNQVTEWRGSTTHPGDNRALLRSSSLNKDAQTWHYQLGAAHDFEGLRIDYDAYYSRSDTEYVNQGGLEYRAEGVGMRIERDPSQPYWPQRITQIEGPDIFDIDSYSAYNRFNITDRRAVSKLQGVQFNVRREFDTAVPAYVKTGLRLRRENRDRHDSPQRWTYIGPNLEEFVNPLYDYTLHGRYPEFAALPIPTIPFRERHGTTRDYTGYNIATALRESPELFEEDVAFNVIQRETGRSNFEEDVFGAYIMGGADVGRLGILAGIRAEETSTWGRGAVRGVTPEEQARRSEEAARRNAWEGPLTDEEIARRRGENRRQIEAEFPDPFEATGKYRKVFPGMHFRYEAFEGLITRASWATNIGRPNITTLIPRLDVSYTNELVTVNNPALRPQYGENFDVSVEYYFEPVGMLSAGVFLKEISDFIFTDESQTIPSGPDNGFGGLYEGFTLRTQANGGHARVRGWELAYQQQFTFLPGFWQGFGVFANYTSLSTKGNYGGSAVRATNEVAGFKPVTANAGIMYNRRGHSVSVMLNHIGRFLRTFSTTEALIRHDPPKNQVDLKSSFRITRNLSAYVDVWNVLGQPTARQEFWGGRPRNVSKMKPQIHVGLRGRL